MPGPDGFDIVISSSWIAGYGDVFAVGARRASGKKMKPRKKRGKPISEATLQAQRELIARSRELRRAGVCKRD